MATINPFKIYENLVTAANLNEYIPQFLMAVEGMVAGEKEKANNSLRRLGKLQRDIYRKDGGIYHQLLDNLANFHLEDFPSVTINGHSFALPSINQSEDCRNLCDVARLCMHLPLGLGSLGPGARITRKLCIFKSRTDGHFLI